MPDRIHKFSGDEGNTLKSPQKPVTNGVATQNLPTEVRGQKRKREDGADRSRTQKSDHAVAFRQKDAVKSNGSQTQANGTYHAQQHKSDGFPHGRKDAPRSRNQLGERRQALLNTRKSLPIWSHADEIRQGLRGSKDVMLLVGETGSGKSTQVPQFLLDEPWCTRCIAITQPRRVAAISLARRVAQEMGTPLGSSSPASKVGYSVRFDNSVSPSTRVKFLTEGMLLQEMLRDPFLRQYSAVIVDEVHERSVNVDLALGFLRNLVTGDKQGRNGLPLKVVVMSATADTESLFKFFNDGYQATHSHEDEIGKTEIVVNGAEDSEESWSGVSSSGDEKRFKETGKQSLMNGRTSKPPQKNLDQKLGNASEAADAPAIVKHKSDFVSTCYIEGRQYPVKIMYLPEPTQDFAEAALKSIFQIHMKEPMPGDILVFLTGQDTVEGLDRSVNEYALGLGPELPKVKPHSSMRNHSRDVQPILTSLTAAHPPPLRRPPPKRSATRLRPRTFQHPQSHPLDQHCRDVCYRPRRALRRRQRQGQDQAVPTEPEPRLSPREADLALRRHPTQGPCGARGIGSVLPAVHRSGLLEAQAEYHAGDSAVRFECCRAGHEGQRRGRRAWLPVSGSAACRGAPEGAVAAVAARCADGDRSDQ